jgi:hypothetical protein
MANTRGYLVLLLDIVILAHTASRVSSFGGCEQFYFYPGRELTACVRTIFRELGTVRFRQLEGRWHANGLTYIITPVP